MTLQPDANQLFSFWNQDNLSQTLFIERLKTYTKDLLAYAVDATSDVVILTQDSEPTQFEWEQAWLSQTGKMLPISPTGILYWYDTRTGRFGGQYGTLNDISTVYRKEPFYPKGSVIYHESSFLSSSVTSLTGDILSNSSVLPSLSFTISQPFNLFLSFKIFVEHSGATPIGTGVDFSINGTKVGTQYYGVGALGGLYVRGAAGSDDYIDAKIPVYNLPAGGYVVQPMIGRVVAADVILNIGGAARGIRVLTAKAVAI